MIHVLLGLTALSVSQGPQKSAADTTPPRFPVVENNDAWSRLPRETPALPNWARMLVVSQPKTTAGVLALDYLHRMKNPLGNELAAKVRWAVARELQCDYAARYAESDLKRMGTSEAELIDLKNGDVNATDRIVLKFARKLTSAGYSITDSEMKAVIARLGPDRAVALVHTVAFANFHDRILLGLGVTVEDDGPCAAVDFKYNPSQSAVIPAPVRPNWDTVKDVVPQKSYRAPVEWKEVGVDELEKALKSQQARSSRISIPDPSRFKNLPPDVKSQTENIVWMQVSAGYQPEMTVAWFAAFRAFQQEGRSNPVYSSSMFWIVTRTNDCFY
jgi:hypothetical protein